VLEPFGFAFATCERTGAVREAEVAWRECFAPFDTDVTRIHPTLVPDVSAPGFGVPPVNYRATRAPLRGMTTRLVPLERDGDVLIVEAASFPLGRDDGSFLSAARPAPGRDADDLARRYLASFVATTDLAVVGTRLDGTILYWSPAAAVVYGYSEAEALGRNITMLTPEDRVAEPLEALALAAEGLPVERVDTVGRRKSGELVELWLVSNPFRDESGAVVGTIRLVRNISTLKESDRRARMYARAVEHSPNGILLWRRSGEDGSLRLVTSNPAAKRICGIGAGEVGRTVEDLAALFPPLAALGREAETSSGRGARSLGKFELHPASRVGPPRTWVELTVASYGSSTVSMIVHDVTALVVAEEQRRRLLVRLAEAEDAQRKQLAEALHDDTIQALAAVNMRLGAMRRKSDPASAAEIQRVEDELRRASTSLRSLVFELYPASLEYGGLHAALEDLAEGTFGTEIETELVDERSRTSRPTTELTAYRVLQEALRNVGHHAHASHVRIRLGHDGDELVATVRDDGVGFDLESVRSRPGHLGVRTMFERTESRGGTLDIRRAPIGTELVLRLPDADGDDGREPDGAERGTSRPAASG